MIPPNVNPVTSATLLNPAPGANAVPERAHSVYPHPPKAPATMTAHSIPSPTSYPSKRPRQSSPEKDSPTALSAGAGASPSAGDANADVAGAAGKVGQSSNFRNVSACNRCRLRKNRCDQKLPSCASCEKAGVACVGYDPITKREIPRRLGSYHTKTPSS